MGEKWYVKLVSLVIGLLVVMVPNTTPLMVDHPLHGVVQTINDNFQGSTLGLVISSPRDEKLLKKSGYFVRDTSTPSITIAGRKFNIGKFNGVPVIYVFAGEPLAAVSVTVQIMIDTFRIRGLINYGAAATVSSKLAVTDVIIPSAVAYYGIWKWKKGEGLTTATKDAGMNIRFGDFNVPEAAANYLGSVEYQDVSLYTPKKVNKTYTIFIYPEWVQVASQINKFEDFNVVQGAAGVASADIYLLNEAYAKTIGDDFRCADVNSCIDVAVGKDFGFKAVDTESAAVVSTAIANGTPHIVIRGASNKPGIPQDKNEADLTAQNVLKVVANFIELITQNEKSYATV